MNDKPTSDEPRHKDEMDKIVEEAFQLAILATKAVINMQWDDVERLDNLALSKAQEFEGQGTEHLPIAIKGITSMNEGVSTQFRDKDPERYQRAIQQFKDAQDYYEELKHQFPEEIQHQKSLKYANLNMLYTELRMAQELGDQKQVKIKETQIKALIDGIPEDYRGEFNLHLALLKYKNILTTLNEIHPALAIMDVDRALREASKVREESRAVLPMFQEMREGVLFKGFEAIARGTDEIFEATLAYAQVLYNAIIGDVSREDINTLKQAEMLYRSGAKQIGEGSLIVNEGFSDENAKALETSFTFHVEQARNLRVLCQESLKPKRWIAIASIKFVCFFLITAITLLVVVTKTNANSMLISYILYVSFVVGLIGGFGFEGLRLLPFADRLISLFSKPENIAEGT